MEEAVEAAATVIKYIGAAILEAKCRELVRHARGAAILEAKCRELVRHARGAAQAADGVGVPRGDLSRAARQLEEAGRLPAVVGLRDASAALEGVARARLNALHGAAAKRGRLCLEYRKCLEGMLGMHRSDEEPAGGAADGEGTQCANPNSTAAAPWRRSFWGSRRPEGGLGESLLDKDDVEAGRRVASNDLARAVNLLDQGSPQLEKMRARLLAQTRQVLDAVIGADEPSNNLLVATDALDRAGDVAARLECVIGLETAATALEAAGCAALDALRDRAGELSRACRELKEAADAMGRVERAAAEQRERRLAGARWPWLWRWSVRRHEVPEDGAAAAAALQPGHAGLGQGDDKRSTMAALTLHVSLTLITYLGPDTVAARVKKLSQCFRWGFSIVLSLWWTFQAIGVPCSAYARSVLEQRCSQILCRLGLLGINLFVIFFLNLALDVDDDGLLWALLISALLIHLFTFVRACCRGDLSK